MAATAPARRHIPYLSFHKTIIREICRPQGDHLLIMAKGLGLRRTYDRKEDLVIVINANPGDEAGIGDELGIMGVREPGFRILTYEMSTKDREEMYRRGGLFSVTSKILVTDLLKGTVPVDLITGIVVLHAETVRAGSSEEFAIRLYRRKNQSGFCKAFSDEPEVFAHGLSPMKDMLINLNMNEVMIWPRYNEAVKTALASRKADVVEMYQPMTDLMRRCQDAITECMEAMLVELKRDHSLNLDLEDLTVRNAQFKNFDTIVFMRLRPVWHKVGMKTKIHVQALAELRDLQTWLLEYDSATFAAYISTLQRQHFRAQKKTSGAGQYLHDWFNAKAAAQLVEASQLRVSRPQVTIEGTASTLIPDGERHRESNTTTNGQTARDEHAEDMEAVREMEERLDAPMGGIPTTEQDDDEVMAEFATQIETVPHNAGHQAAADDDDDVLHEVTDAPPVFRPLVFSLETDLSSRVASRIRKGHESVLEEQPKWALLARVLKEIEDTIARVSDSHADQPGTNTVLVMTSSDLTCLQLRQYLTTMMPTDPPFSAGAGRKMMETLYLSNWQHEKNGQRLSNPSRYTDGVAGDQVAARSGLDEKRIAAHRGAPSYKRRRRRAGAPVGPGRVNEPSLKEDLFKELSAFEPDGDDMEDVQVQWALNESLQEVGTSTQPIPVASSPPPLATDATSSLLARAGVIEEDDLNPRWKEWMLGQGMLEDWDTDYGLLEPEDAVIIRPYGGEDDDIMLQELRPRFVVMYEPNLAFIRRLEVYKNSNPGLPLRVYQMTYTNSFEEDRFLATMAREGEAFKKLIEDRGGMVIPIYNNNPRAPMRDTVTRSRTTYSTRNAGGGESEKEESRIIVDIRELGAFLPSLIDGAGIHVIPATLTVGDYILSPKMVVERKALPDLEQSLANGRLHTQCEAMSAHYEVCILLIEFEEDKFGMRTKADAERDASGRQTSEPDNWQDTFYLQSKLALLALHFPRLRIIWSSSPHESVKILSDLKLNHDEPDELTAILKGTAGDEPDSVRPSVENAAAVEMLRAIPGVSGHNVRHVMANVETIREFVGLGEEQVKRILGEENGAKAFAFMHGDGR
ncbi:DNA repair protein RAD16 [Vanrija albida]|uniref:DNA repair protein RAD16 n=1 Tax=Vanrija albida TaxID=181172 RepID=A0ABR3Q635_9TREE